METQEIEQILDQLANKEISEYKVSKEQFMDFRKLLIKRPDFKHFRGIAEHNADIIYQYTDTARS